MRPALVALALVTAVSAAGCGAAKKASVVTTTVTVTTTTTTTAPTAKPVPADFDPVSFTAVSDNDYWVLGNGLIAHTTDGGKSFTASDAPPLPAGNGAQPELRFTNARDGYAFTTGAGGALYTTQDGGATWQQEILQSIVAFASGGGHAYVVYARCTANGCTGYRFMRSAASGRGWTSSPMPFTPDGSPVDLAAHGSSVWLLGTEKGSEPGNDTIARSTDAGQTFTTGTGPCVPGLGGGLEPSSALVVWAVCPTGMEAGAWISTDGGVSFGALKTPELVNSVQLAPASDDTAVLAQGPNATLLRTTDAGSTWSRVSTTPHGATSVGFIGFTDANVGVALVETANGPQQQQLWRTTDGGASWSAVAF